MVPTEKSKKKDDPEKAVAQRNPFAEIKINQTDAFAVIGIPVFRNGRTGEIIEPKLALKENETASSVLKKNLGRLAENGASNRDKTDALWYVYEIAKRYSDKVQNKEWTDAFDTVAKHISDESLNVQYDALTVCRQILESTSILRENDAKAAAGKFSLEATMIISDSLSSDDKKTAANASAILDAAIRKHPEYSEESKEFADGTVAKPFAELALAYWESKKKE